MAQCLLFFSEAVECKSHASQSRAWWGPWGPLPCSQCLKKTEVLISFNAFALMFTITWLSERNKMTNFPSPAEELSEHVNADLPSLEYAYRLVAMMFRYPDKQLWKALSEALSATNDFSFGLLGHSLFLPHQPELEQAYTSLFCANPRGLPAPPYLSCYFEEAGQIEGSVTQIIRRMLTAHGLVTDPNLKEPDDHVSVILELAGHLCREANGSDATKALTGLSSLVKLTDIMLIMLPQFRAAIAAADISGADFYRDASTLCLCLTERCRKQIAMKSITI